ncbi:MAG: TonB-dependent receptor [Ignavibacteria bacterium]|jgi:hypothetical protein
MKIKVFIFCIVISSYLFAQTGTLSGKVIDAKSQEALIGVNITVNEIESMGTATDEKGRFLIKLPVGSYSIKASIIGYTPVVKTDIIIRTGRETTIEIFLEQTSVEIDEIEVNADYFDETLIENNSSTVILGAEEVKRSPGSVQDFQRILQAMAGVSFSNDQNNELLVRGGSPNENLTVLDNIEIHSTNHYPNEYNSGGPINMVNVDLIKDIQFSTGGFISKYGDKLSSVMVVESREGTRTKGFASNVMLSMAGYGGVFEGQINNGKGSWLLSARKSYIDLIAGSVGLTAVPYYYDFQFKAVYDLSRKHKLSLVGIYGNDKINIEGEPEITNLSLAGKKDTVDVSNIDVKQYQFAAGLSLKSIWSDKFYSILTVSKNNYNSKVNVTNDFTERHYDNGGEVGDSKKLKTRYVFNETSDNGETALRSEFVLNLNKNYELNFGGSLKFIQFNEQLLVDDDTVRYDINMDGIFDTTVVLAGNFINYDFDYFEHNKSYFYINNKFNLFNKKLEINLGLRYDQFTYSEQSNFGPRISASYKLIPGITSLNFAYGDYYQTQSLPLYGDRFQTDVNRKLKNTLARHYVAGIEHILEDGLKVNLEGYYKKYSNIPVNENFIYFNDRTSRSEKYLNIGEREIYGLDLLIQQKLVKDIYGTLAFSRMWTEEKDPRIGYEGETYISDYDFPYVVTLIVGKRFKDLRTKIDKTPFFIKFPSYLLPFSDDMEIGLRWRYASGKTYTPYEYVTNEQYRVGETQWTKGSWVSTNDINSARYPDYHRLDITLNSRYNFENWNLVIFLSIQNLYNRKNIAYYQYNSDGTRENIYQFQFLPVVGFEIEL